MSTVAAALKPRKSPRQARSAATVEALHTAAVQVLTRDGLGRCTTTRIAARAGMSVGSLYQYYPNRDALVAAALEKHLDGVADAVDRACGQYRGKSVSLMASGLVAAFLGEKLRDPATAKALYAVAGERGGAELVARIHDRILAAISEMLASAADVEFEAPSITATILLSILGGAARTVLDGRAPPGFDACLEGQLVVLLTTYLKMPWPPLQSRSAL